MSTILNRFPEAIPEGYAAEAVTNGESGGRVYRLTCPGRQALFFKYGSGRVARDILDEIARLQWLQKRLPAPRVRRFGGNEACAWMLTTALGGRPASECLARNPESRTAIVQAMAEFLQRMHRLPVESCPFRSDHRVRMFEARRNLEAGLVDVEDFDEQRRGWTAERVWAQLSALAPGKVDSVVTHGDYSLDNIHVSRGRVVGVLDVGRLGVADPYQDLAILWSNLAEFGPALQQSLLDAYGTPRPDRRRLEFHLCLDEFF